jgi:bacteriocin-like protein
MNTQTFAQVEDFKAITDEELMAVNGGTGWDTFAFSVVNIATGGLLTTIVGTLRD